MRTIIFHDLNRIGLGNRLSAITLAVERADSEVRALFAIGSSGHLLLETLNLDMYPLLSHRDLFSTTQWRHWSSESRLELCNEMCRSLVRQSTPNLAVIDCYPDQSHCANRRHRRVGAMDIHPRATHPHPRVDRILQRGAGEAFQMDFQRPTSAGLTSGKTLGKLH
jgi:hypothetical protein